MRVWMTGGAGFVGQRLAARLKENGVEVDGADHEVDVTDLRTVRSFLAERRPDAIVHLAGITFVPDADRDPLLTWRVNYAGTRTLLEAAQRETPDARIVAVSSAMVYGTQSADAPPFDEDAALRPAGPYATTKAAADLIAGCYAEKGLDVVRVRPFNHTGPGRPAHFVESSFARQIAAMERGDAEPVMRVGNLESIRDFLHVDDVVDAYVRLLQPGAPAGVFNVASGRPIRIQELLDALLAQAEVRPAVETDPARWRETDSNAGNADRLVQATGWSPRHSLEETLGELLNDWRVRLADEARA
jgi:GDP-4-dehydro-6-deoxy-D-mannose reductase